MTKKKNLEKGEQLPLIDVEPENLKEILVEVRTYKKLLKTRQDALTKEITQKQKIISLVKAANLTPLADGSIRFKCEGYVVSVTPRDVLIKISGKDEAAPKD